MGLRLLNSTERSKLLELANRSHRPEAIIKLSKEIAVETRAAEIDTSNTGVINNARVQKIVRMRLRLDDLYADWARGKIE